MTFFLKYKLYVFCINIENSFSIKENYNTLSLSNFEATFSPQLLNLEYYLIINILLFLISLFALTTVHKSMLHNMLAIELLYFSSISNFLIFSFQLISSLGDIFTMLILALVSVESIMGLTFVLLFFLKNKTISINFVTLLQT